MHYCHEVVALPEWCRNGLLKIFPLNLTLLEYTFSLVKFSAAIMKSQPANNYRIEPGMSLHCSYIAMINS